MKKFLVQLFLFSACLLLASYLCDLFLSAFVKKSTTHAQKEYPVWNDIFNGEIKADLIINGSSRAWVNIDPHPFKDRMHLSSYNIGIDGHNFVLQNLRYALLLKYNKKPKYIIHSLDLFTLETAGGLYNPDQFLPYMLWNEDLKKTVLAYEGFEHYDFEIPLIRYSGKWDAVKTAFKLLFLPSSSQPERVLGYQGQQSVWNSDFDEVRKKMTSYKAKYDPATLALFETYLKNCAASGTKVVLVYAPEYGEGQKFVSNRHEIIQLYQHLAKKYTLSFFDFSKSPISNDKGYFYNVLHLNKNGAELFTQQLIDSLQHHSLLVN